MPLPNVTGEFGVYKMETKFSQKGNLWVSMRCSAKDRKRDPQTGQWMDGDVCWIDVIVLDAKIAEMVAESVVDGDTVVVSGRLKQNSWETESGEKRSNHQILVDSFGSVGLALRWRVARSQESGRSESAAPAAEGSSAPPF